MSDIHHSLKFLVCVDGSEHSLVAFKFCCTKAAKINAVVEVMTVVHGVGDMVHNQIFLGVNDAIREEKSKQAQLLIHKCIKLADNWPNLRLSCSIREGYIVDSISNTLERDSDVVLLILGAESFGEGNSLLPAILSKLGNKMTIPIMLIPGNLNDQQINELAN